MMIYAEEKRAHNLWAMCCTLTMKDEDASKAAGRLWAKTPAGHVIYHVTAYTDGGSDHLLVATLGRRVL
jgi:hypothetical protein